MMKKVIFSIVCAIIFVPLAAQAAELHNDLQEVLRAQVVQVLGTSTEEVPFSDALSTIQELEVQIIDGERRGETVIFNNDYIQLESGDLFYMNHLKTIDGTEFYSVRELDRRGALGMLLAFFVVVIIGFGGMQGVRSLLSLAGSLLVVVYALLPSLVSGLPPVPTSIAVASVILFFAIFFTHGFNRRSSVAYGGTVVSVVLTGVLATLAVQVSGLSGFASEESVYLNLNTGGTLNFVGLLLAAIIIGALGVLDDVAVTQVAVVRELYEQSQKKWEVYKRAMRVGREHVGALVNTLVLAYTGAALPLLLLFSQSESHVLSIINREMFATEIVRTLVGSIGLVLTVPITTLMAVYFLEKYRGEKDKDTASHTHVL